jgi:hypothetical protein
VNTRVVIPGGHVILSDDPALSRPESRNNGRSAGGVPPRPGFRQAFRRLPLVHISARLSQMSDTEPCQSPGSRIAGCQKCRRPKAGIPTAMAGAEAGGHQPWATTVLAEKGLQSGLANSLLVLMQIPYWPCKQRQIEPDDRSIQRVADRRTSAPYPVGRRCRRTRYLADRVPSRELRFIGDGQ